MNAVHETLTGEIIGAAMTVSTKLKPGLDEKLYERALMLELTKRGHAIEQQRIFPVLYDGVKIGDLTPDLIVDGLVIADPKVVTEFNEAHIAQMIGYLRITGLEVALLLNFKQANLRWKRIIRQFPLSLKSVKSAVKKCRDFRHPGGQIGRR
jgi:GxxExxY protein